MKVSALHLVYTVEAYKACLARSMPDDTLLLLGDAVYVCLQEPSVPALEEDMDARGVRGDNSVSYEDFVALCCDHTPVVSWFKGG